MVSPVIRRGARLFLAGLLSTLGLPAAEPDGSWRLDFDKAKVGTITGDQLAALSPVPVPWTEGFAGGGKDEGRFRIVESAGHGRALEVRYPRGGVGPRQTGGQWVAELVPRDTYELEYRLRFDADFDWRKGGKLPGLGGGTMPTGGRYSPDGFSSRYMWREGGRLVVYLYWAGQESRTRDYRQQFGANLDCGVTFERGRAYRLRQRVSLNTPGKADGVLEVWVDDRPVLKRTDLLFRDTPAKRWQIDRFLFSTFHGGKAATWAPAHDCTVEFDDIKVRP